jgi:hypothetical protein
MLSLPTLVLCDRKLTLRLTVGLSLQPALSRGSPHVEDGHGTSWQDG